MKYRHELCLAVALLSVLSCKAQADSFHEALIGGKISGEVRNTYVGGSQSDARNGAAALNNSNVLGSALSLTYETGAYQGLKAVVGLQSGHDWGMQDDEQATIAGGEDDSRVSISSTDLLVAYLEYAVDKSLTDTRVRIGRQKIVTPLLMSSGEFPMQDSFDAVVIENHDLPGTQLRMMAVNRWNKRYGEDSNDTFVEDDLQYHNPVYSLYLTNNSISGLTVEAQWLSNRNDDPVGDPPAAVRTADKYDSGFLGLTYKIPDSSWILGAKALTANYDKLPDTGYWGVKAQTTVKGVLLHLGYTSMDDDGNFPGSIGHVPMFRSYKTGFIDEIFAGLETTSLRVGYGFGLPGANFNLIYSGWRQSDKGIAVSGRNLDGGYEAGVDLQYQFQRIKGLKGRLRTSYMDFDRPDVDKDDFLYTRVLLNYSF
ncbi:OprD family outer membrane porin [Aestuariicella sp. G3-2]|uniref:OprD family outer membrane porin n=1 Tax=Pseudomaricurvus albidus TaxID=2842452 RepID=UPI001C0D0F8D|nr:OprD family outer membrane porin [Aestuariicella albida]MBU3069170.1 OprD family outer membrane porin [Aestuariicella albida]